MTVGLFGSDRTFFQGKAVTTPVLPGPAVPLGWLRDSLVLEWRAGGLLVEVTVPEAAAGGSGQGEVSRRLEGVRTGAGLWDYKYEQEDNRHAPPGESTYQKDRQVAESLDGLVYTQAELSNMPQRVWVQPQFLADYATRDPRATYRKLDLKY